MTDPSNRLDTAAAPGTTRCPGPSTADIIRADGDDVPGSLTRESYTFLGDADIPFARYTAPGFYEAEIERVWGRTWQWACREEHIPEPGDYQVYDVGPYSAIVVRDAQESIRAYVNACPHRGTQLCDTASHGRGKQFLRCPFHGMSWHLDGSLRDIPCRWDFPHVEPERFGLTEIAVGSWGGFVFVNFAPDAEPLQSYLGVLPQHFAEYAFPLEERYVALHMQKTLPGNWKMCLEAFLEAYHVLATHPEGLRTAGDANAQYDVFGRHVNRFVHTIGYPSPHLTEIPSERALFAALGNDPDDLPADATARAEHARRQRARLGAELGVDLSSVSTSQMLDSIEYFLFPNACFFPGISIPLVYRFRPLGPEITCQDVLLLKPCDPDRRPPPAEPIQLALDDSYRGVSEFVKTGLAGVLDQDTANMHRQLAGIRASRKLGQTLGNYQEVRIRHLHQTLDTYLNAGQGPAPLTAD